MRIMVEDARRAGRAAFFHLRNASVLRLLGGITVGVAATMILGLAASRAQQLYDLPNDDTGCPANCRQIPWDAGSDQWNNGTLPTYGGNVCSGLVEGDGTTDNTAAIQACINAAGTDSAVILPAGIYYINGTIRIKSRSVLRGAGAPAPYLPSLASGATTLKIGSGGSVNIGSGVTKGTERAILSGYTKGSTTLLMSSGHGFVAGDWISVFEDGDSSIPATASGEDGTCTWCGENNGSNLIQQFVQVSAVSGDTITISRPMYYSYKASSNPGAKKITWSANRAGIESIKLNGWSSSHPAFITLDGCLFCWVKAVETYNAGTGAKANHVNVSFSHGAEIRDSYFHLGRDSSSDRNYGLAFFWWNSDHKIENNILRHHRHSLSFEGGGSGNAILYNYIDDNYTDDLSYLGSARTNHGGHPMFNLYEGNQISHLEADDIWGSSSHMVFFRNWLRGAESGVGVPSQPTWGFWAIHIDKLNNYYSSVGNILGVPSWTTGTVRTLTSSQCSGTYESYRYGCDGTFDATAGTTSLNHGNYDYITDGVAYWEGGTNHALRTSMYYNTKPSYFGVCSWPVFGPDLSPMTKALPAKARFDGVSTCGTGTTPPPPAAPSNLRVVR